MATKSTQLQIRVTPGQKAELKRLARHAGQDVSTYVLTRALPEARARFEELVHTFQEADRRFVLAELNDLLASLTGAQLRHATAAPPPELGILSPLLQNYVAAMVEQAAEQRKVAAPGWTGEVPPLEVPYFATQLRSLRPYLLGVAPVPFKRRNIFVDAGVGARV